MIQVREYQAMFDKAMKYLDEAESNILDAYDGTSDAPKIRKGYARKRTELRTMARAAGINVRDARRVAPVRRRVAR